ncbi:MAG TPA: YciI family protein [Actinomycetota bacterium]|nr:YciI family protein [Actinomycetota bacterium]
MKYLIAMFGDQATMVATKSREWIVDMIRFMDEIDRELTESGEKVDSVGLVDPTQATTVRFEHGAAVPTDGPFAEAKESLAGYYLVDVEDEARAVEIASKIVDHIHEPIEVRQLAAGPPEEYTT